MKLVAISQRVDAIVGRNEIRDGLDQKLQSYLVAMGFLPVPVPNSLSLNNSETSKSPDLVYSWLKAIKPSAIVLSGGNDIGEYPARDLTERALLNFAYEKRLPVLGICRGMQMMSNWAGGVLKPADNHIGVRHKLIGQIKGDVNSFHRYSLVGCPEGFEVTAQSEDGQIEAFRHISLPWEGWMWHPERENRFNIKHLNRVRRLLNPV